MAPLRNAPLVSPDLAPDELRFWQLNVVSRHLESICCFQEPNPEKKFRSNYNGHNYSIRIFPPPHATGKFGSIRGRKSGQSQYSRAGTDSLSRIFRLPSRKKLSLPKLPFRLGETHLSPGGSDENGSMGVVETVVTPTPGFYS